MYTALISDIHSNYEALDAVLHAIDMRWPEAQIVCAGDVVGYGPDPNKCINILRERSISTVRGNHDEIVLGVQSFVGCAYAGIIAAIWTRQVLTSESRIFLRELPSHIRTDADLVLTHGDMLDTNKYVDNALAGKEAIHQMKTAYPSAEVLVCVHTHHAAIYSLGADLELAPPGTRETVSRGMSYIVNPGSVGQSRDGTPVARYAIYNSRSHTISWHAQDYDHKRTVAKLKEAQLVPEVVMMPPRGIVRYIEKAKRRWALIRYKREDV